jgi:1,4-dihydroxy-2-naphthoate octaprenyltransferase
MASLKTWWGAARPRTVLLSLSGILMGGFLAFAEKPESNCLTVAFCALTAITLQILSNLANDYGDYKKGVDNNHRTGPQRTLQSGALNERQMRGGIVFTILAALLFGALLIFVFARLTWTELAVFASLGVAAVCAALLYTLGKRPYGYRGLGDLFCFLFFGWVAVAGTYYLATKTFDLTILLPATALGCCSNAVLNINNMRDYENDKASGKNSLVVKLGLKNAFRYHSFLLGMAFASLTVFAMLKHAPYYTYAFWLVFPMFFKDLMVIRKQLERGVPDRLLPRQVLHTLLLTLVFGLLVNHNLLHT